MRFERLVGLNVVNEEKYRAYRAGMTPILATYGGSFRYDFRIEEVLQSEAAHAINRVFVISFPDRATSERFFADPAYIAVRRANFESAVEGLTLIADYVLDGRY